ncbi:hypothetical protein KYY02_18850 [Streptomyces pimonensis]|uniref:Uncharacterized protein n=1 Tax=Streptomyces pimonensis TaxID=2860288 RepID=A0ABV4J3S7_9ACTN
MDLTARDVRHIQVRVSASTGWNAAQLSEAEVHSGGDGGNPEEPPVDGTDLALGEPAEASSTIHSFVAANANDGRIGSQWESNGHPVGPTGRRRRPQRCRRQARPRPRLGEAHPEQRDLGRERSSDTFASPKARADHTLDPGAKDNTVTSPVTGRYADVRLRCGHNSGERCRTPGPPVSPSTSPATGPASSPWAVPATVPRSRASPSPVRQKRTW